MTATNLLFEKRAKRAINHPTKTQSTPKSPIKKRQILADFTIAYQSRVVSNLTRKEVLNGRAKFGLESSGKELLQLAMAHHFQKGDFLMEYRGVRKNRAEVRALEERYARESLSYVFEYFNGDKKELFV